jgi:hypothetical protein
MSKKSTTKSIEIPAMYLSLTPPNKERSLRKVIIDVTGKVYSFKNESVPVPPEIEPDIIFKNFDDFSSRNEQTILTFHANIFKSEPPKKQRIIQTALMVWAHWIGVGSKPILVNVDPETGEKKRESTILKRLYKPGEMLLKQGTAACPIKTRQALVCLQIFVDALGDKPSITEEDLRRHVETRAAEIKTKQDPWRIFQYYRPNLIKGGMLRHD